MVFHVYLSSLVRIDINFGSAILIYMEVVMTNKQKFNYELTSMLDHSTYADRLTMIQRARILYLAKLRFGNSIWDADAFVEAKGFINNSILPLFG